MKRTLLVAAMLACATPLAGQSLFSASGLGYPITPVDGRAALLGGTGIGLLGLNTSLTNPAEPAGLTRRGISAGLSSTTRAMALDGVEAEVGATRFPLLRVIYPIGARTTLSLGYGGFLDQSFAIERQGRVGLDTDTFDITDQLISSGGIAQLRLGAAYGITEDLAVGLAAGVYTGNRQLRVIRRFQDPEGIGLGDLDGRIGWNYSAPLVSAGVLWDPLDILRLAGSVTWSGELRADSSLGPAVGRDIELPLQVSAGTSAFLADGLVAAFSAQWSGWQATAPATTPGTGGAASLVGGEPRDTWELGGGVETTSSAAGRLRFPLRAGFRWRQLPFGFAGGTPTEWSAGAGIGMRVGGAPGDPLASLDLGLERGGRSEHESLEEDFWRLSLSLSVFGN